MRQVPLRPLAIVAVLLTVFASNVAQAQWALVAKRAIGRVEQMSQQSKDANGPSYDSAAVMLEAPADNVYMAVMRGVKGAEARGVRITHEDAAERVVQFTNGDQIAGIKVSALGGDLSHLLVTSAHSGAQPNAAALVMDSILRVCREMNVECSVAQQQ
jgi:hypothetical protein